MEKISEPRLAEIARLQTQLSEMLAEVLPCEYQPGRLIMPRAPGQYGGTGPENKMSEDAWRLYALPKLRRVAENIKRLGYVFTNPRPDIEKQANVIYDQDTETIYLIDFHDISYKGVEDVPDQIVQIKNPKTGRYTKINNTTGEILAHKKSDGPYKGIKEIPLVETDYPAEPVITKQRTPAPVQPDPSRRWFGKKIKPVKTVK